MNNNQPHFYKMMNYPVPSQQDFYRYVSEIKEENKANHIDRIDSSFSRDTESELMKSYQSFLSKHMNFLKNIPFISQIYLCNSITFNALHDGSDIDLCIITKPGYLWYARLWSWLYFFFLKLKRKAGLGDHSYKFCLSFYIDGDNTNLISIRQKKGDIYLSYRIAHAVLLYTNHDYPDNHLHTTNRQLLAYIPNHPKTQTIFLRIPLIEGENNIKKIIEKILTTLPGKRFQKFIQWVRGGIINTYKTSKLSHHTKEHTIVSPTMLKFHTDKRTLYQQRRKNTFKANS